MTLRRSQTIRNRVTIAVLGSSLAVLVLATVGFISYEIVTFREGLLLGMQTRGRIIAANVGAALAFSNPADATDALSALRYDKYMQAASVYDDRGKLFAQYPTNMPASFFPPKPSDMSSRFQKDHFDTFVPVTQGSRHLGTVYLRFSLEPLNERYRFYGMVVAGIFVVSVLLALALSHLAQRRLSVPLLALAETAEQISQAKDYSARAVKRSDDEIGALTDSFNAMLNEIQRRDESLRFLANIVTSTDDAIYSKDAKGIVLTWNRGAERMFGYTATEMIGRPVAILNVDPGEEERILERVSRGEALQHYETRRVHKDGRHFDVALTISPVRDPEGTIVGYSSIARDMTERKRIEAEIRQLNAELEKRVEERTAELKASNKELEAFSYSVSHDLRAPLRSIDGFSKALLEDAGDRLDKDSHHQLDRIRHATQRMGNLIDDLLKLSRISRAELHRERIDLSELAHRITAELEQGWPGRRVNTVIQPGLVAEADPKLMQVLLDNLLGNAWKYTAKHTTANIEFGAHQCDSQQAFFVRDDGAGFDMKYSNMLFAPFQRLHRQGEFEGTGIGLATVQRIIHRHGGKIWAEAAVEKGATFYFTI